MKFAFTAVLLIGCALMCIPCSSQVLFEDDFESGMGNWSVAGGCTQMDWYTGTAYNAAPAGGSHSAYANLSQDRMYHDLGMDSALAFHATWYIYDSSMTRAYGEVQAHTSGGYGSALEQIYAAGKFNQVTKTGEVWNGNKYQGRILYPSGTMGWFNLDAPGSPNRSPGWHRFDIESMGEGTVRFYVDGILSRTIVGANARTVDSVVLGFGTNSSSNGDAWFDGVKVSEVTTNLLSLNTIGSRVYDDSVYFQYGEIVPIHMDVSALAQKVNGCQAMLGYSNYYLFAQSGCVAPGGGVWDQLIYNSWDVGSGLPGEIDTAIGVDAYGAVGTDADGTVANIQLVARDKDGVTHVIFRPDVSDVECTWLSDMNSLPIVPNKTDTCNIVIDGTPADLQIVSATQSGNELLTSLGSTIPAVQGRVDFLVTASDLNGLPAAPAVNVYDSALVSIPCVFDGQVPYGSGNYYYHINVPPSAMNGLATVRAAVFDKAGNRTDDLDHFLIDKNQITGQVESEGFIGASRDVTFVATGVTTKTWTLTLTGWSANKASYTLTSVPAGTTGLSAKTAWSLRSKLPIALAEGQATADFVGTDMLLGGDLNESNSINVLDYSIMKSYWYTTSPLADIDGSGLVQTADYNTMKANWFKLGDDL